MPEWSIGAVSKTVDQLAWSQGSNPCLSAQKSIPRRLLFFVLLFFVGEGEFFCNDSIFLCIFAIPNETKKTQYETINYFIINVCSN